MLNESLFKSLIKEGRKLAEAESGDEVLGALKLLPGTWSNKPNLPGRGWNMIALPYVADNPDENLNYRLLMNEYNETLDFSLVDKAVPNRGITKIGDEFKNTDQILVTLDYTQQVVQSAADDFPKTDLAGKPDTAIHHEPGLFLLVANDQITDDLSIARLASVPHGNSALALGRVKIIDGPPVIPVVNGLPIGVNQNLNSPYLAPYKHFNDHPFQNLFNAVHPNELLRKANVGVDIVRTTELHFDTKFGSGGINNIPFIKRQADASEMIATFWIQELAEKDAKGNPKLRIQYSQTVFLDFFPREDGTPGLIRWPHVSINTMENCQNNS